MNLCECEERLRIAEVELNCERLEHHADYLHAARAEIERDEFKRAMWSAQDEVKYWKRLLKGAISSLKMTDKWPDMVNGELIAIDRDWKEQK